MSLMTQYPQKDVRLSFVWRQRCFNSEEDRLNYHNNIGKGKFKTKKVIDNLLDNLIKIGKIKEKPTSEIDIVLTLLSKYVYYPYPETWFPYNFCVAVEKFAPWLRVVSDLLCS